MPAQTDSSTKVRSSWRGEDEPTTTVVRHKWEAGWNELQDQRFLAPMRRARWKVGLLLLVTIGLAALFIWGLLYTSMKTPVVAVAATNYNWPLPLNPYAQEDLDSLERLSGRTLEVHDSSSEWDSKQRALQHLEESLHQTERLRRRSRVSIVYLSLHGTVDEQGNPYLIPAGASHLHSASWISIDELLDQLQRRTASEVPCLLIMDCVKHVTTWEAGELYNSFSLRLKEKLEQRRPENIAVICAASDGEVNHASADLHRTIFGSAMTEGLAGFADDANANPLKGVANGDGRVSVRELHHYALVTVNEWVKRNRATEQTPWLWPAQDRDFYVTWSLNQRQLKQLQSQSSTSGRDPDHVDAEDIGRLWQSFAGLRQKQLFQCDPLGWSSLEQQLLRLEQMSQGGVAYRDSAIRLQAELQTKLRRISDRIADPQLQIDWFRRAGCLRDVNMERAPRVRTHSMALGEVLGQYDLSETIPYRETLLNLTRAGDATNPAMRPAMHPELSTSGEANFVELSRRQRMSTVWDSQDIPQRIVTLRDRTEKLVCQGDPRLNEWLLPLQLKVDQLRRRAEDLYFAGDQTQIAHALTDWEAALAQLDPKGQGTAGELAQTMALRDLGFAEAHYLAQWLCHPDAVMERFTDSGTVKNAGANAVAAANDGDEPIVNYSLLAYLRGLHDLSDRLSDTSDVTPDRVSDLMQRADVFKQHRDELYRLLRVWVTTCLDDTENSSKTLRNIRAVLGIPTLAWDQRLALSKKAISLATELHENVSTGEVTPGSSTRVVNYLERIRSWDAHPCLILHRIVTTNDIHGAPAAGEESLSSAIERMSGRLKQRMGSYPSLDETLVIDWLRQGELQTIAEKSSSARFPFALSEQIARAAAPGHVPTLATSPETDPILKLLRYDAQALLLNYADRTLEDFYATAKQNGAASSTAAVPFFASATDDLINGSRLMLTPTLQVENRIEALQQIQKVRMTSIRRALTVSANQDALSADTEQGLIRIQIESNSDASVPSEVARFPSGIGTVVVAADDTPLPAPRQSFELPFASSGASVKIPDPQLPTGAVSLQAIAFYRGHEFLTPLIVRQTAGVVVRYEPRTFDRASVTLTGEKNERAAILFILDSSWSMREEIAVEAQGTERQPKLALAQTALKNLLRQLAARGNALVGVRVFGHRIAWSRPPETLPKKDAPPPASRIVTRPNFVGDIPDRLDPGADTELILPVGRFDARQANGVEQLLDGLEPWGQSPLYLSIADAVADLSKVDDATERSIVVITDGDNFQFTPSGRSAAPKTTLEDAQRACKTSEIPVYILGLGVPDAEAKTTSANFAKLAKDTGGKHYDVDNGADLLTALQERLSLGGYQVYDPKGNLIIAEAGAKISARLNATVPLDVSSSKDPFILQFQDVRRELEVLGGERFEIALTPDGQDMVSIPYDRELPIPGMMRGPNSGQFTARVHQPFRNANSVTLPVSIQDEDQHFTRRPSELWIEVTPIAKSGELRDQTYIYYDPAFEPGKPVPYMKCTAANWPSAANKAAVRVWSKESESVALFTLPLAEVASDPASYAAGQSLSGVTGVRYRVQYREPATPNDAYEIRIIEEHDASSKGVGSLRIQIVGPDGIEPMSVTRQFDARGNIAIHTYAYATDFGPRVAKAKDAMITFVTRSAALSGAYQLEEQRPIVVDILSSVESLPLDAATGKR